MALSGQITITAMRGPSEPTNLVSFQAHPAATGILWIGRATATENTVDANTGYPLKAGQAPVVLEIDNLGALWFNASVSGEKICWIKLN